ALRAQVYVCASALLRSSLMVAPPTGHATLSLHDALPIWAITGRALDVSFADWRASDQRYYVSDIRRATRMLGLSAPRPWRDGLRSEEHTSELQSRENLVCRLLLEKKKHERKGAARRRSGS